MGLVLVTGKIAKGLPDEPDQFAGHGDKSFVAMDAAGQQMHEATMETVLSRPADFEDVGGPSFLAAGEFLADFGRRGVVLAAFHKEPTGVGVSAFGDRALSALFRTRGFAGDEAEVGHELARMIETWESSEFGDHDHGGHDLEAF